MRQKVQRFLDAARTGNLDLLKSKLSSPPLFSLSSTISFLVVIFENFLVGIELAVQLDEGKGLGRTVTDVKDANKRGAIHFAAIEGRTEVCKYLLEELKLDVDMKDEDGVLFKPALYVFFIV